MQSKAKTVKEYIHSLPQERRREIERVRGMVLKALPKGYEEGMQYGMIGYYIPLEMYPDTYNGEPLGVVAIASQKRHLSLYLHCVYMNETLLQELQDGFIAAGKKLDMGKSCIRFQKSDDLALDVLADLIARTTVDAYIAAYEASRVGSKE